MMTPEITLCPDGHYRRVIYGIGPYIADYPEQVLLSCIVQGWCPRYANSTIYVSWMLAYFDSRCTALPENLDGEGGLRTETHSALLVQAFSLKEVWTNFGIVGDVTVCISFKDHDILTKHEYHQPFTASFPRADIHELLTSDLLHQVIKGTFKDHLVTWVCEYLEIKHGEAGAAAILLDIDRR
jgi:hypothetical protein